MCLSKNILSLALFVASVWLALNLYRVQEEQIKYSTISSIPPKERSRKIAYNDHGYFHMGSFPEELSVTEPIVGGEVQDDGESNNDVIEAMADTSGRLTTRNDCSPISESKPFTEKLTELQQCCGVPEDMSITGENVVCPAHPTCVVCHCRILCVGAAPFVDACMANCCFQFAVGVHSLDVCR